MTDSAKDEGLEGRTKIMSEIVGHLKNRPFLLVTAFGLLTFLSSLFFEIEKLKEFKELLSAVILLPLGIDFFLQYSRTSKQQREKRDQADASETVIEVAPAPARFSIKAIVSLVFAILVLQVYGQFPENELKNVELQAGLLVFAIIAGGLGVSAMSDARLGKVRGKRLAIAGVILSSMLILFSLGMIVETGTGMNIDTRITEHEKRTAPPNGPQSGSQAGGSVSSQSESREVPLEVRLNLQQGMNYALAKDYERAAGEFSIAINKFPDYGVAYSNRAAAYIQLRKFSKAMDDLNVALELMPDDSIAHYNLTALYSLQNQLDRAADSLDTALRLGFNDYDSLRDDPDLANLRAHSDYRKILEKHKIFIN